MAKTLGRTIRELRLQADMNQEDLAREAGMSASNLSKIENDIYTHPRRARVIRLAEALGRRLGWSQAEIERWKRDLLRMAGWATDELPGTGKGTPLEEALAGIGSLAPVDAVGELLRLHGWPADKIKLVLEVAAAIHPKSSDEPASRVA